MKKIIALLSSVIFLLLASCAPSGPQTLTVMTHDSFSASETIVAAFEKENNAKVVFLKSGDAGEALNKAILSKDAPLADLLFGVDNTFLSRALESKIFAAYSSSALTDIPNAFKLDPTHQVTPIDYGDVCINYDKAYFAQNHLAVPQSLEDLTKPEYKGLLVVENPATSSPGLAFLLVTRAHFGDAYLDYWRDLRANGIVVVDGWETAYYANFSASSGRGPQAMVVSYATSPAAEVVFAETPLDDSPTASILNADTCFRQIEFIGILKGTKHRALAEKFIDFMLSTQFQNDMPLQMFVYPINQSAQLPEAFTKYAHIAEQPAALSPEQIAANRDKWIDEWTKTVLK